MHRSKSFKLWNRLRKVPSFQGSIERVREKEREGHLGVRKEGNNGVRDRDDCSAQDEETDSDTANKNRKCAVRAHCRLHR